MKFARKRIILLLLSNALHLTTTVLNPHDEDFFGNTADTYNWSKHPCRRNCSWKNAPQTCHYVFVIEQYYAMGKACYNCPSNITDCYRPHCMPVDGVPKKIYTVNRQLPGPPMEVCEQDTIVVDCRNRMLSESTTIHWHGFKQRGTPYMDGVPYVSQCPILPGENFRYTFKATDPGTFFYHSHIGNQRADGLFGMVVVNRFAENERMAKLYDHDNLRMIINDWSHITGDQDMAEFYYKSQDVFPENILVNGHGHFQMYKGVDGKAVYTPLATFDVEPKMRYRVRLVNSGNNDCPIAVSIDNHTMQVINLDSNDIEPVEVDVIIIWPGERTDFVVNATQPPDNYYVNFNGYAMCYTNATVGVHQKAILRYAGASSEKPKTSFGYMLPSVEKQRILNPYNVGTEVKTSRNIDIPDLRALEENDISLRERADQQFFIGFNFHDIDNYDFNRKGLYGFDQADGDNFGTLQFNHISLKLPPVPLMSQWNMLGPDPFCDETHPPKDTNCTAKHQQCACTHLIKLKKNSVIELVFVAEGPAGKPVSLHPLHLHGHFFRVLAMEKLEGNVTVEQVKKLDREGKIRRTLDHAPLKDTIKSPHGGYVVLRLITNNPGYWFFHCHYEPHSNIGMALIFKSGEHEDFPKKPKKFPTCGNYA